MKYLSVTLLIAFLLSCTTKKTETKSQALGFNGFSFGTSADSIVYALGYQPETKTSSQMVCSDVTYQGVRPARVTYHLAANRLTGGMVLIDPKTGVYDTLASRFTKLYGKPVMRNNTSIRWEMLNKDELFLSTDNGRVAVIVNQYKADR